MGSGSQGIGERGGPQLSGRNLLPCELRVWEGVSTFGQEPSMEVPPS